MVCLANLEFSVAIGTVKADFRGCVPDEQLASLIMKSPPIAFSMPVREEVREEEYVDVGKELWG